MSTPRPAPGRVAVLGAGPAGMAAALGILKAGHEVVLYERYPEARPAGNILNLWPPPLKALRALGVDITDFGAPTDGEAATALAVALRDPRKTTGPDRVATMSPARSVGSVSMSMRASPNASRPLQVQSGTSL